MPAPLSVTPIISTDTPAPLAIAADFPALSWRNDRAFQLLLAGVVLLGLIYNFAVMISYGPDEPRHMNYVKLLLDEHRLPLLLPNGTEYKGAHTLHPPLYYALLVPVYALFRGLPGDAVWHIVRLVSLALGIAALFLGRDIALRAAGAVSEVGARRFALFALCSVALLPIWGMTAGTVNNDSSALLAVTAFLWLLAVKYPRDESPRAALVLGLCLGLGGLCKATALLCDGGALVAYFLVQRGFKGALLSGRTWLRLGIMLGIGGVVCGWWYARNHALYGNFTPIAHGYSPADMGMLPPASQGILVSLLHDHFPPLFEQANWGIFTSMWSQIDWIPEGVRPAIYGFFVGWLLLALIGLILGRIRGRVSIKASAEFVPAQNADAVAQRVALWSGAVAFAMNWSACLGFALFVHWGWYQGGRYLLSSLWGLGLIAALGWRGLLGGSSLGSAARGAERLKWPLVLWCMVVIGLNLVCVWELLSVLNPKYGPGAK